MSNGKKVAPQPIENDLKLQRGVAMAVLIGDDKPFITALLSPDFEALKKMAEEKGFKFNDQKDLLTQDSIRALFDQAVGAVNESLSRYEKIKKYHVLTQELSQETGELTPTLKVKRRVVAEKYGDVIRGLYTGNGGGGAKD